MPRLIKQSQVTNDATLSWSTTGNTFTGIPPKCRLTTLRIVLNSTNHRTTHAWFDITEDSLGHYSICGRKTFLTTASTHLSDATVDCCVVQLNQDYSYTINTQSRGTLFLWVKTQGGVASIPFKAYLIYTEA